MWNSMHYYSDSLLIDGNNEKFAFSLLRIKYWNYYWLFDFHVHWTIRTIQLFSIFIIHIINFTWDKMVNDIVACMLYGVRCALIQPKKSCQNNTFNDIYPCEFWGWKCPHFIWMHFSLPILFEWNDDNSVLWDEISE